MRGLACPAADDPNLVGGGNSRCISAPLTAAVLQRPLFPMLLGFALLVIWKHRENILRLQGGNRAAHWEGKA